MKKISIYNLGREQIPKDNKVQSLGNGQHVVDISDNDTLTEMMNARMVRFENPIQKIYEATSRAIKNVKVSKARGDYEPFYIHPDDNKKILQEAGNNNLALPYRDYFPTIRIDNGQFDRIMLDPNYQIETAFPAVFVRFINIRYLVAQQRIGEGRATMRVRFILDNLNNSDDIIETMPFRLFQLINTSIQNAKAYEDSFDERINLTYNDMPERTRMLQAYWIDYEVWFKDYSGWVYNNYIKKYLVAPPYTNHSDYPPEHNENNHEDHKIPTYDDVSKIKVIQK